MKHYDIKHALMVTLITLLLVPVYLIGQDEPATTSQTVQVTVAKVVRLERPTNRVVTLDPSEAKQFSEEQRWGVVSNSISGARMTLKAKSFSGERDPSRSVPVRLDLNKEEGRNWNVPRATDTSTRGKATVRARSDGPGNGTFRLNISLANTTSASSSLEKGETYTTTVVGTVRDR